MSCQLTVLMAVHNGGAYLRVAIDSILRQTYSDFHFLIVDDASTDYSLEVIRSYQDSRIQLIYLDRNVGQTAALNVGLHRASTKWIARMDADDYSDPHRLKEQMQALDADPAISCIGAYAWTFRQDPEVVEGTVHTHLEHSLIKKSLLRGSPLIHGTIIVDRDALLDVGAYNDRYRYSADVDMYDRLLDKYQASAIPQPLLGIRRHEGQGSRTTVAFDENIEIFSRRLSEGSYSRNDAATIRTSLSRFYLFRSRRFVEQGHFIRAFKDLASAIRVSPAAFIANALKVFLVDLIPEERRATLKRLVGRVR